MKTIQDLEAALQIKKKKKGNEAGYERRVQRVTLLGCYYSLKDAFYDAYNVQFL